jgi:Ca2+-binding RTX toxin-like protein
MPRRDLPPADHEVVSAYAKFSFGGIVIEQLETRRHLTAVLSGGTLTVTGTLHPDQIEFGSGKVFVNVVETTSGVRTQTDFQIKDIQKIVVNGGDAGDLIVLGKLTIPSAINGEKGNDSVTGGQGNDTIMGDGGNDSLNGSGGRDLINGGIGGDAIYGGAQIDSVDYNQRTANLTVGIGTIADDGEAGEGDNIATDIEVVIGGSGNDFLRTSSGKSVTLIGNAGNDTLEGGSGADVFNGGAGTDSCIGHGGDDFFTSRDGQIDTIIGNGGHDSADADSNDVLSEM